MKNPISLADYLEDEVVPQSKAPEFYTLDSFDAIGMDQLRVEFMRISPSYAYVSGASGSQSSKIKKFQQCFASDSGEVGQSVSELRQRLSAIQKTHSEYGSIDKPVIDWYRAKGRYIFDNWTNRRNVKLLGISKHEDGKDLNNPAVMQEALRYIKLITTDADWPKTMLLAIPFDLPKNDAKRQTALLLDAYYDWVFQFKGLKYRQKKELAGVRERPDALVRKLKVLICKAFYPELPLWKIGLMANICPKKKEEFLNLDDARSKISLRPEIATLTSRALRQGQYIAEHAAMDSFPVPEKIAIPYCEWSDVKDRILRAYPKLKVPEYAA